MVSCRLTADPHHWCDDPVFNSSAVWFRDEFGSRYVAAATACSSGAGCILIIVSFLALRQLRRATSRHILVFLSVADLGASIANTVGSLDDLALHRSACKAQAFFTIFWSLSSVLWSTSLAIYLYVSIVLERVVRAKQLLIPFHVVCWGLPLLMAVTALSEGALGSTSSTSTVGWCWIDVEPRRPSGWPCADAQVLWMLLTLKLWELISYIVIPSLYIAVRRRIRKETGEDSAGQITHSFRKAILSADKKLRIFPVVYVLLRVWGTIRGIIGWHMQLHPDDCKSLNLTFYKLLTYLQAFGDNAQGLVNFILYFCMTNTIQQSLRQLFARLCCPSHQLANSDVHKENAMGEDMGDESFVLSTSVQTERRSANSSVRYALPSGSHSSERSSLMQPHQREHAKYGIVPPN